MLSSLERRQIPLAGEEIKVQPFGNDKPSNSLFIPPELYSVNCYICNGSITSLSMWVAASPAGTVTDAGLNASGTCENTLIPIGTISMDWKYDISYGDGSSDNLSSTSTNPSFSHVYNSAGSYGVSATMFCPCPSIFVLDTVTATAEVEEACNTGRVDIVGHNFESKTSLKLNYEAKNCTLSATFTGAGQNQTLQDLSGPFSITVNPQAVSLGSTEQLILNPSSGPTKTITLEREYKVKSKGEVMFGKLLDTGLPTVQFNQTLNEVYQRFEVNSTVGIASKIVGGYSTFLNSNSMQNPLPSEIAVWNASHRYFNASRGDHQNKSMSPATGFIPGDAYARSVTSTIDYNMGETSTGKAKTTAIQMASPSGHILVTTLINFETDVAVD